MIHFDVSTHIYRPLTMVFKFIAAPENDFQWQYATFASAQITPGEVGIGTLFRTVGHFMGRRIECVNEVTEYEINHRYAYKSVNGPVALHTTFTFLMTAGSTAVNISTEMDQHDLFQATDAIVEKKFKRQVRENLGILKTVLESHKLTRLPA